MNLSDFDFDLPEELIAQTPAKFRDRSRLMVIRRTTGHIHHDRFSNLPDYLSGNPIMIFNDTRVLPVKLTGKKKGSESPVEILLLREIQPKLWEGLIRGLKKLNPDTEFVFQNERLAATLQGRNGDKALLRLRYSGNLQNILEEIARMPLPPYIHRNSGDSPELHHLDRERYQTVYATKPGAVAAPTAGLHFTEGLLKKIGSGFAETAFVTLHVGLGTFKPIREEDITKHVMEDEEYSVPIETWNGIYKAKCEGRKVLAVGTTATRVLESVSITGPVDQPVSGKTNCYIYPGYRFKMTDHLLTNFHLPKSTLFLLVCAFAGKKLMDKAYEKAIRERYRFFSYGDAMLIL